MSSPGRNGTSIRADTASPAPVACRCRVPGISPRPDQDGVVVSYLAHLYLCEGLSTYRVGQLTGLDRQRVTRLLHRAGVPLRPRGAGGTRPDTRRADPPHLAAILTGLYVKQRLSTAQIGQVLGMPERTVRARLRQYGIRARTRGGWQREDRRSLPAAVLRMLYGAYGLSADDVGRRLNTSRKTVLRNMHDLGMPVRTAGAVARSGLGEIQLIDTLYADELVRAVLADHKIAEVPAGGPIWQRFPQPVLLTERLVADLYWHCGVGLIHIELVTGQPEHTVRGFMRRAGIATRHPGGRSPFLRRWRTGVPIGPGPPWDGRSRHAMDRAADAPSRGRPLPADCVGGGSFTRSRR